MPTNKEIKTKHSDSLSDKELNRLDAILSQFSDDNAMDIDMLDGFFSALHCCPEMVPPGAMMNEIWGGGEMSDEDSFDSESEAKEFFGLVMDHWNNVGNRLSEDDIFLPVIFDEEHPGNSWCQGFLRGTQYYKSEWLDLMNNEDEAGCVVPILALAYENDEDPKMRPFEEPLTAEKRESLLPMLSAGVMKIYEYFKDERVFNAHTSAKTGTIRRESPKVGRNSPCPCGSGKKFKKCCSGMKDH